MRLKIDVAMHYWFSQPNTVFLALEAANCNGQTIVNDSLELGDIETHRIAGDAEIGERVWALVPEQDLHVSYSALVDITRPRTNLHTLEATPLHLLPGKVVPYLRPSRYCQSDKFTSFVGDYFGHLCGGQKVAAIRDWIEAELTYLPGSSHAGTDVLETFAMRHGVCRDYAHLLCTLVRAAQIPARMAAVYSPDVQPPDFHAIAEVWLGGQWQLVDATGMSSADSTAVIAVGRDAYDIAFMDSQAYAEMLSQSVSVIRG